MDEQTLEVTDTVYRSNPTEARSRASDSESAHIRRDLHTHEPIGKRDREPNAGQLGWQCVGAFIPQRLAAIGRCEAGEVRRDRKQGKRRVRGCECVFAVARLGASALARRARRMAFAEPRSPRP